MSRLIDADELKGLYDHENYEGHEPDENWDDVPRTFAEIRADIDDQPTVDAVPVKHGHWVFSENDDMFYCTNCKNGSVRNDYPYCHWCGAKMDIEYNALGGMTK